MATTIHTSPKLNNNCPTIGVNAEADAIDHKMNNRYGVTVRCSSGTGATPTVSSSPETLLVREPPPRCSLAVIGTAASINLD